MPTPDDYIIGQLAVRLRFVSQDHIDSCLDLQDTEEQSGKPARSLDRVLVDDGFITAHQVEMLKAEVERKSGPALSLDENLRIQQQLMIQYLNL